MSMKSRKRETIIGVIAGLPLFGFMGIIFGPLLVSLFLLFIDMFRKEYLAGGKERDDAEDESGKLDKLDESGKQDMQGVAEN